MLTGAKTTAWVAALSAGAGRGDGDDGAAHAYLYFGHGNGTGVDRRFIAPKGGAFGVAVEGAHIYWTGRTGTGRVSFP